METITKHLKNLGIQLEKITRTYVKLTWNDDPDRLEQLCRYYFNDNVRNSAIENSAIVAKVTDFNPDGHGIVGICKKCGCTQNDACYDEETGSCWWVKEDLCSACASKDQKMEAVKSMSKFFRS